MSNDETIRELTGTAMAALQRGNAREALALLTEAGNRHPAQPDIHLHKALALRVLGDYPAALGELDAALAIDPYLFIALLSKGALLERMGRQRAAAQVYRDALTIAPRSDQLAPALETQLGHAREFVATQAGLLAEHLRAATGAIRARYPGERLERFDESLDVFAGTRRIYNAEPVLLHVPRLPAIPFFERDAFPWLSRLEDAAGEIRAELLALVSAGMPDFAPYIDYPPGTPVNQWAELNHSRAWSSFWLWRDGQPQQAAIARCPRTAALLAGLPMADQPGFAPTALFSALAPRTRIPPHTGSTNARLLVHLPLVVPGPARFRVGNETRSWEPGKAWVFDDTIEHEAWNDSDETRIILIFDIWNPLLSTAERELLTAMLQARKRWLEE